jgi:hypothetical protein
MIKIKNIGQELTEMAEIWSKSKTLVKIWPKWPRYRRNHKHRSIFDRNGRDMIKIKNIGQEMTEMAEIWPTSKTSVKIWPRSKILADRKLFLCLTLLTTVVAPVKGSMPVVLSCQSDIIWPRYKLRKTKTSANRDMTKI